MRYGEYFQTSVILRLTGNRLSVVIGEYRYVSEQQTEAQSDKNRLAMSGVKSEMTDNTKIVIAIGLV